MQDRLDAANRDMAPILAFSVVLLIGVAGVLIYAFHSLMFFPKAGAGSQLSSIGTAPKYEVVMEQHQVHSDLNENKLFVTECWKRGGDAELHTERYPSSKNGYSTEIRCYVPYAKR